MPGDPLKHVQAGQRLEVPAAAYNAFADATATPLSSQRRATESKFQSNLRVVLFSP
jgi:hypothetical protein